MSWEELWEGECEREREMVEWAVRKAFLPPQWFSLWEGAERRQSRDSRKRKAKEKELKVKIPANPSLLPDICRHLLLPLAKRGYLVRIRFVRLGDLVHRAVPLPGLRARGRIVRIVLEVEKPAV